MDKDRLIDIFGQNLLDDLSNETPYRELCGLIGHKPWECVGEILEASAVLFSLEKHIDWANDKIVLKLHGDLLEFYGRGKLEQALSDLMKDSNIDLIPDKIKQKVMRYAN